MALRGLKVVEFAGLAPGPFAGLVLADFGASVVRIDRPASVSTDVLARHKRSIAVSAKTPSGKRAIKRLVARADVLIDPFRPGVLERLGLGPSVFLGDADEKLEGLNKRLIYARIVGFERTGPHKDMAGHDINYLALSGILSIFQKAPDKPIPPLNILADFAGGGLTCTLGILLALLARNQTGRGQVVDADMVSGTRYLSSFPIIHAHPGRDEPTSYFASAPGTNPLDGGAPFYTLYSCADDRLVSVGCLEPQFFAAFLEKFVPVVKSDDTGWVPTRGVQGKREEWSRLRRYMERGFRMRDMQWWADYFHGTDCCVLPVLTLPESAALHSSRSPVPQPHPPVSGLPEHAPQRQTSAYPLHLAVGQHTEEILAELGLSDEEMDELVREGALDEERAKSKL